MKNKKISFIKFAYKDKSSLYTSLVLTLFSLIPLVNAMFKAELNKYDILFSVICLFIGWILIPFGRWMNYTKRWL